MEAAVSRKPDDRRAARRHEHLESHGIVSARVKPGHRARVVDVSAGGALIETSHRLMPGAQVELQVESRTRKVSIGGRVLRAFVVRVFPTFVCYRGAIGFDRHLPWFADSERESSSTDARPAAPGRADATPQVI
jgi:PilZ domain